jgi:hypothetical protein
MVTNSAMKSHTKTLILLLGVLVAAAILIASVYFKDTAVVHDGNSGTSIPQKKGQPEVILKKALERFSHNARF